jgi:hypothetical protein
MPEGGSDDERSRLEKLIDERIVAKRRDIGILISEDDDVELWRTIFDRLKREQKARLSRSDEARKTWFGLIGTALGYVIAPIVGGIVTWFLISFRGHS